MKEFFVNIYNSLTTWFFEERGWAHILAAVAVILLGLVVVKIVLAIVRGIIKRTKLRGLAGNFILTILKIVLYIIYIIAIMKVLGIDTTSMVAILAASSLAISLAMQEIISNFASGMILVTNHNFKEGDYIETAGVAGTVVDIKLFSTTLLTVDNKVVTIPNSHVTSSNIINYSAMPKRRLDLTFGVAYGTDIEKAKAIMTDVLDKHASVLHDDGYTVRLSEQAESALVFVCRCWINSSDYWNVYFDLMENMTKRFTEEGIEIPYNKLDVFIKENKG